MFAIFKENYTIKIYGENNIHSGQFTFMKGKSYQCRYCGYKLKIWDNDMAIFIKFNKKQINRYLEEII